MHVVSILSNVFHQTDCSKGCFWLRFPPSLIQPLLDLKIMVSISILQHSDVLNNTQEWTYSSFSWIRKSGRKEGRRKFRNLQCDREELRRTIQSHFNRRIYSSFIILVWRCEIMINIILISLVLFLLSAQFLNLQWKSRGFPPGPTPFPIIGSVWWINFRADHGSLKKVCICRCELKSY